MKMNAGMYMSTRDDYETPPWLFEMLDRVFHFNLDVCADERNTKVPDDWISVEEDGLAIDWTGSHDRVVAWMNPPYGKAVTDWTAKAVEQQQRGAIVVGLLAARTDAAWFHRDVAQATSILLLNRRVKFLLPCTVCGTTTDRRREPSGHARWMLEDEGFDVEPTTFPLCDACQELHAVHWGRLSRNSPGFGSMVAVWGSWSLVPRDVGEHGTMMVTWR